MVFRTDTSGENEDDRRRAAEQLAMEYNAKVLNKLFSFLNTPTTSTASPTTDEKEPPQAHN